MNLYRRLISTGLVGIGTTSPGQKPSVAGTIESTTGGVKFPDGTTQASASPIKAWVNFNASTQTINGSYNVSSITYVSTGQFQINFTNPMSNAYYVVNGACQLDQALCCYNDGNEAVFAIAKGLTSPLTTTYARVICRGAFNTFNSYVNPPVVTVSIIGN